MVKCIYRKQVSRHSLTIHCCQCSLVVSFMFKPIKQNWTYSQIIHVFPWINMVREFRWCQRHNERNLLHVVL